MGGKSGKVCKIEPQKCMLKENINGKYLVEEGIYCPIHIPSKNREDHSYEDWEQKEFELLDNNNDDKMHNYDVLMIVLVPYCLFLLFIWYKIFKKITTVKMNDENSTL